MLLSQRLPVCKLTLLLYCALRTNSIPALLDQRDQLLNMCVPSLLASLVRPLGTTWEEGTDFLLGLPVEKVTLSGRCLPAGQVAD
jgi:hypothetical protein